MHDHIKIDKGYSQIHSTDTTRGAVLAPSCYIFVNTPSSFANNTIETGLPSNRSYYVECMVESNTANGDDYVTSAFTMNGNGHGNLRLITNKDDSSKNITMSRPGTTSTNVTIHYNNMDDQLKFMLYIYAI